MAKAKNPEGPLTSQIAFVGTIKKVGIAIGKAGQYGSGTKGGIEITLVAEYPEPPREPYKPYQMVSKMPARPAKKRKEEDDAGLTARQEQHEQAVKERAEQMAEWATRLREHAARVAAVQGERIAYATLAGIVAVFGDAKLLVTLTPRQQGFLAGFGLGQEELPLLGAGEDPGDGVDDDDGRIDPGDLEPDDGE